MARAVKQLKQPERPKRPSIVDVARLAGVSIATASRVSNKSPHAVSQETRERVLKAIDALDYHPSSAARSLVMRRTRLVAALVHDISDSYFGEVVKGIERAARSLGYQVMVCNTDRDPAQELQYLDTFRNQLVDGVLFVGGGLREPSYQPEFSRRLNSLKKQQVQVVAVAPQMVRMPVVEADNVEAAREMTRYLIGQGHRRIAFIGGPRSIVTSHERWNGFRAGLAEAGLAEDPDLVRWADFTAQGGIRATEQLLCTAKRFTALLCSNDLMAFGALSALKAHGLRVPDDVSVAGIDDIPLAALQDPPLTTISIPMVEMGVRGMELLVALREGRRVRCSRVLLEGRLVVRESVRRIGTEADRGEG